MKLWLLQNEDNRDYDYCDACIVAATSEAKARKTHPIIDPIDEKWDGQEDRNGMWCSAEEVKVKYIGTAIKGTKAGVILASYNA